MTSSNLDRSIDRVTDLATPTAADAAERAARAAGVRVELITALPGLEAVYRLYDTIWRPDPKNPPVTTELLRALTKAGNYVAGAYDGDDLVGACVGFFGAPRGDMHSHIAGVAPRALGRSVGFALKLHLRAWAMAHGVSAIEWTFDPLVRRNAYFNLVKLGARPVEYLPNFYGGMHDTINGGDDSDRLLIRWRLDAPEVVAACAGSVIPADIRAEQAAGAVVVLDRTADGRPRILDQTGRTVLVAVPADIESLRTTDPEGARQWRRAVREVLAPLLAGGAQVSGFDRDGWFVVRTSEVQR